MQKRGGGQERGWKEMGTTVQTPTKDRIQGL